MTATVLVVGASGYLGRSVVQRLRDEGLDVVGTYCSTPAPTADVQFDFWTDDVGPLVDDHGADTLVYTAANEYGGDIDTGDADTNASFEERAERFADQCAETRVVYVSSASVFDGTASRYSESDPRSPRDAYGRRLVTFEDAFGTHCDGPAILRTSYLFGFSRATLDYRLAGTREALENGESVEYFTDMYKSPVLVTEAADAVVELATGDVGGPVHVPTPRVSVYEFYCEAMGALGHDPTPVERAEVPAEMDVAPDLSLSSDRFASVVDFEPSGVATGLRSQLDDRPTA